MLMNKQFKQRKSFAQISVGLASNGLVLLAPETRHNLDRTSLRAKSLSDYCHTYIIARRPGIKFVPGSVVTGEHCITGKVMVSENGQSVEANFSIGCDTYAGYWIVDKYPHKRLLLSHTAGYGLHQIPNYVVPSIGVVDDARVHRMEVLYIGQSFGDGDRTALDRLQSHETLQRVLADALHATPDQDIVLLLVEYAPPKLHLVVKPETETEPAQDDDWPEIQRRMQQLKETQLSKKNQITMVEAALINYFKPNYNKKFVDAAPNEHHKHLEECYNADFSALIVELNTEDAQMELYSHAVPPGLHHLARFDLHDPQIRGDFFNFWNVPDETGLLESGLQPLLYSLRNGRFAYF